MKNERIERELLKRAEQSIPQKNLIVNYYRIRRKLAWPLPVREFAVHTFPLRDFKPDNYPWSIWLAWALEERILTLGGCGEALEDSTWRAKCREVVREDLEALSQWPAYRQLDRPDLSAGHLGRTLWAAHKNWIWLGDDIRKKIKGALQRLVEDILPYSEKTHGAYTSKEDILASAKPHEAVHNIPLIGTIGAALAAHVVRHPAECILNDRISFIFSTLLELRKTGFTEAAAYDGYVLDFFVDWLAILPEATRNAWLSHPEIQRIFDECYMLAAPGRMLQIAELGDVEPHQMPFHASAQAKLFAYQPTALRQWYLTSCDLTWLRADALNALLAAQLPTASKFTPDTGVLNAHYAHVLRSGWASDDLAVAVSTPNCSMGHIHYDCGSLVIGTASHWLITDPGYQQYIKTSERDYAIGDAAHNSPIINGVALKKRSTQTRKLTDLPKGISGIEVDLTKSYQEELKLSSVRRTVWLHNKECVVVADRVIGNGINELQYFWHGHADVGWRVRNGAAQLALPDVALWMLSPQCPFAESMIDRQRGSRGQLTLNVNIPAQPVIWWVFSTQAHCPIVLQTTSGLNVDGLEFTIPV